MAGTVAGGKRAAQQNRNKYGEDFYKKIGTIGGSAKVKKGFALMDREKVVEAGRLGGRISRRISRRRPVYNRGDAQEVSVIHPQSGV